uniref:Phostensin/Taperin PP1-binding domain-containing protein n=1 Tax=Sinocyclocheilus rhinocerous TaxID=307959 RepID=A0A673I7B6_9TELE
MSLSALPEWKQLLLERKRREEEERERREREEEERLASMPAWKRGIIQRRRAKQDEEKEREKERDGGHPIQQSPFIRSENSFKRDNRGKEVIRDGENEYKKATNNRGRERNKETEKEIWRGRDREMWVEKMGSKSEGRERDRSTGRESWEADSSASLFSPVKVREENEREIMIDKEIHRDKRRVERETTVRQRPIELETKAKTESERRWNQDELTIAVSKQPHGIYISPSDDSTIDFPAEMQCQCVDTTSAYSSCPTTAYAGQVVLTQHSEDLVCKIAKVRSFTINARNTESTENSQKPPEQNSPSSSSPCTASPSSSPSPPLFSIRSASGGPGKRGTTITITPRRPAGAASSGGIPTVTPAVPKAAPQGHITTPAPSSTKEAGKKRYPTAEEIEVIGGYQNLERSCLVKSKGTPKAVSGFLYFCMTYTMSCCAHAVLGQYKLSMLKWDMQ